MNTATNEWAQVTLQNQPTQEKINAERKHKGGYRQNEKDCDVRHSRKGRRDDANTALQVVLLKRDCATLDGQRICFREN